MKSSLPRLASLLFAGAIVAGTSLGPGARPVAAQAGTTSVIVPRKTEPNRTIAFSFQQADIDDVLRFLADASGKIVFKDSTVQTTITIRNQTQIPVSQAIRLVQTILALKGYSLQETEDAIIVRTTAEARTRGNTRVTVGKDMASIPEGNEIITHIFPLENVDAVRLREEFQPLFPAGGGIVIANSDTNSLIVIDEAANVRRLAQLINNVDRNLATEIGVEVIRLKFASATEMARYLTEIFRPDEQQPGANRPQGGGGGGFPFGGGGPGGPGGPGGAQPQVTGQRGSLAQMRGRVRFAADERSNSLIVYAAPANMEKIRELVAQLDVNIAPRTEYRIVPLQYSDATGMADQLTQLLDPNGGRGGFGGFFGGFNRGRTGATGQGIQDYRVVPDVRTNSIVITAPVDDVSSIEALIRQLDKPAPVQSNVRVFQLENAIASEVATTLRNLFLGTQNQGGGFGFGLFGAGGRGQIPPGSPLDLLRQVTIVPNDQTNQLLVSGPAQTFPVIETLLDTQTGLDRRLPQVFIEVIIADITLDDETKFGIEWNLTTGTSALGTSFGLTSPTADNTGFKYSVLSDNIQATLQALRQTDRIKIVSTPHVLVTDNSPALISIGESIPYAGETTISNGVAQTSVDFQDVAITLNVTPHISPANHILMDIDQVVNSLIGFINVGPNQTAPRTTSRRAGTTVIVQDDQTVVLGGIISNNETRNVGKVPILGDIPFLGHLFRNQTKQKARTELVVFLTPHVVREPIENDRIRDYERGRLQVDPIKELNAPFSKPLDIRPQDLRPARRPTTPRLTDPGTPPAPPTPQGK